MACKTPSTNEATGNATAGNATSDVPVEQASARAALNVASCKDAGRAIRNRTKYNSVTYCSSPRLCSSRRSVPRGHSPAQLARRWSRYPRSCHSSSLTGRRSLAGHDDPSSLRPLRRARCTGRRVPWRPGRSSSPPSLRADLTNKGEGHQPAPAARLKQDPRDPARTGNSVAARCGEIVISGARPATAGGGSGVRRSLVPPPRSEP